MKKGKGKKEREEMGSEEEEGILMERLHTSRTE